MEEWNSQNYQELPAAIRQARSGARRTSSMLGQLDEHERDLRQDELAKPASRPGQQQQPARAGNVEDEIPGHVMTEAALRR